MADDAGLEFTHDSFAQMITDMIDEQTRPIEDRLHEIERHLMAIERSHR